MNHGRIIIRYVSHIRSIAPFINAIIENYHKEGMNTFSNIMSDSWMVHLDIVCSLYEGSLLNAEKKYFWMQNSKVYTLQIFNAMMNTKTSSSSACAIYPRSYIIV